MVIEMLVGINKTGHHNHALRVDDFIEVTRNLAPLDGSDILPLNYEGSIGEHVTVGINGDDTGVLDESSRHDFILSRSPKGRPISQ